MNTLIHIKTDKIIKQKAQKTAKELGLTLSSVINAQLRQFVKDRSLSVSEEPLIPSKKLEKVLKQVEKDIKSGKNMSPVFTNTKDAIDYLHSL